MTSTITDIHDSSESGEMYSISSVVAPKGQFEGKGNQSQHDVDDGQDQPLMNKLPLFKGHRTWDGPVISPELMSCGLGIADDLGLAYRFGYGSDFRDLYIWPAQPTIKDREFWHPRGSHIHVVFVRDEAGNFEFEQAVLTLRHKDDIGTTHPVRMSGLAGAFHFDVESTFDDARASVEHLFVSASWFWSRQLDPVGTAWKKLDEAEYLAYLTDWDHLLEATQKVCNAWHQI